MPETAKNTPGHTQTPPPMSSKRRGQSPLARRESGYARGKAAPLITPDARTKAGMTNTRKPRRSSGWSAERRARHAAAIRSWAPWKKSTGPRTEAGKAQSSQNARKPANPNRIMAGALHVHRLYIADIKRYLALRKKFSQNELLNKALRRQEYNLYRRVCRRGPKVTLALVVAFVYIELCAELLPPSPSGLGRSSGIVL